MQDLNTLKTDYMQAIVHVSDRDRLEKLRVEILGKKGVISLKMRTLGGMNPVERKILAPELNMIKNQLIAAIAVKKMALADLELEQRLQTEWMDVSLAGRSRPQGTIHPISQVTEEIIAIFSALGFKVSEGPEIETDYYNFDALNIAPDHPARQAHDTFYFKTAKDAQHPPYVLRTHTSPVQIRYLQNHAVPCRIICPGRVYRADYDQTHTPMFHQYEGLCIDKTISMAHLKWTVEQFCQAFFEIDDIDLRFRASHFPFTEPSAEADIRCSWQGRQLKIGEGDDWMEILGCGMVHPKVLTVCGIDPQIYQGFAFGMGIDRIAMLKYGIPDLRAFFDGDLRWLRHYGFASLNIPNLHSGLSY